MMTFEEFVARVADEQVRHPEWRVGQTAFNVLWKLRPELAEQVRVTEANPYYLDDRLPAFYEWLEQHWEDE